jgi:hypothetical protein
VRSSYLDVKTAIATSRHSRPSIQPEGPDPSHIDFTIHRLHTAPHIQSDDSMVRIPEFLLRQKPPESPRNFVSEKFEVT